MSYALRPESAGAAQYRVCFIWEDGYADQVEVTDYH